MKVADSSKHKSASKANGKATLENKTDSKNMVLGQIKLEDLEQERLEVRKSVEKKTASKKQVEKKSVNAVKAAAVETKAEAATTAEAAAVETEEVKTQEPKVEETKEAEVKKETKPAAKPAKAAAKKETKTTKTAKTVVSEKVVLQIGGRQDLSMDNLIERVKAAYVAEGHKADSIKNIEVYIKLDENMAYYVIDGYASGISLY